MIYTLEHARAYLCRHADMGMTPDDPRVDDRINEAILRIMLIPGLWDGLVKTMKFKITQACFVAPEFVETILKARLEAYKTELHTPWYEFMDGGLGMHDVGYYNYTGLIIDQGDRAPVQAQPSTYLGVFATSDGIETHPDPRITVLGEDEYHKEIWTNGTPGVNLPIKHNNEAVISTAKFFKITGVIKPRTKNYVRLYAGDPVLGTSELLAYYHPMETNPSYRMYHIGTGLDCAVLYARCKLRFAPAIYPTDALLVQNMPAIKAEMQAIRAFDSSDIKGGMAFEALAKQMLSGQLEGKETPNNEIDWGGQGPDALPDYPVQ